MIRRLSETPGAPQRRADSERLELLAQIAGLYYEERLTQEEIAAQTGYSRSMISRLLAEARDQNVVEVRVNHPLERRRELELSLQDKLGLEAVRVLARGTASYAQMLHRLGALAARWVEEMLRDNVTIGVSWGTAIGEVVNAIRPTAYSGVHVVTMIGSLGTPDPEIDGPEQARRLARALSGRYSTLPTPLLVDSETTRNALLNDPKVRRVIGYFSHIRLALVGVGTVDAERASLLRAGYLNEAQLEELQQAGAVGDVCALHFDLNGRLIDTPLTRRIVGIDAEQLRAIPLILGVAGGQFKAQAIVGAARAGLINRLVTDEVAANAALESL